MSQGNSKLQAFSQIHYPRILEEIRGFFVEAKADSSLRSLPRLLHSIEVIEEFVLRGGKGIRGQLVVLGFLLGGGEVGDLPKVYKVAAGVELYHKYLLNLDDMADRDEKRNGGPTIWKKYENEFADWKDVAHHARTFAEIDGMLLNSFAFEMVRMADFSPLQLMKVVEVIDQVMCKQTIAGWQIHYFQNQQSLAEANEEEYLRGLELVTGQYTFVAPLKIGLILAGNTNADLVEALEKYGHWVGRAFQIHDDILGLFGDSEETGKPVGNDVREGKKTLLLQEVYKRADAKEKKFLESVCGKDFADSDLVKVQEIVKKSGSLEYSERLEKEAVGMGVRELEKLRKRSDEVEVLKELALFSIQRKS